MGDSNAREHFASIAEAYRRFRPSYPEELAAFLAAHAGMGAAVWEGGCGSGQFTASLAATFAKVVATDASFAQVESAPQHERLSYLVERAEASALPTDFADLCVAAQAVHWFDLKGYYSEVRRVGKAEGLVGLVSYGGVSIQGEPNRLVQRFVRRIGPFWPLERRHVELGYRTLWFPFREVFTPPFVLRESWNSEEFLGYVRTWSAVGRLIASPAQATLTAFERELRAGWPRNEKREVRWRLNLRLGRLGRSQR